ncbi:PilW family protein [Pseudomonas chengduensis]|nr:PilW family protein [Pseudomonas chengduensis]MDH1730982.1 PilW family protein [Pseudomonas chengduensis]SDA52877.1 type IV pilus assembly protein PilW [Pseudomonas sp. NFPP33]
MQRLTPSQQRGLSMIELLIAMAISSFLILGITQIFIDNKRNYIYQQNQSANQEGSRFSLILLEQQLYKAGYRRTPQDARDFIFPAAGATNGCMAFAAGQVIRPTTNGQGICMRYQRATNSERDCQGNTITSDTPVTIKIERTTAGQLQCAVRSGTGTFSAAATLLENVSQIQFEYGIDSQGADRVADAYVTYNNVPSLSDVIAVRYATLLESTSTNVALSNDSYYFPLSSTTATTPSDSRLYRSVQGTTTLRNIAP